MKTLIIILIILIILIIGGFSLWAFCRISARNRDLEEQMEIERKLMENERKLRNGKR